MLSHPSFLLFLSQQYLCKFSRKHVAGKCTGMIRIKKGKEADLQTAVAFVGPVTAVVDSRHNTFQVCRGHAHTHSATVDFSFVHREKCS